jgi:hypothetical protein
MEEVIKVEDNINTIIENNHKLFGESAKAQKINAGFTNTIYVVNDMYIIKICTNPDNEKRFEQDVDLSEVDKWVANLSSSVNEADTTEETTRQMPANFDESKMPPMGEGFEMPSGDFKDRPIPSGDFKGMGKPSDDFKGKAKPSGDFKEKPKK